MTNDRTAATALRQRSRTFRIATGTTQVVLGIGAGYLINWATLLGTLNLLIAAEWELHWLLDIWFVPLAVTSGLVATLWFTRPTIRPALIAAATSSLLTTATFVWIFATW